MGTQVRPRHFPTKGDLEKIPPADFPLIKAGRSKCEDKRPKLGTRGGEAEEGGGREAAGKREGKGTKRETWGVGRAGANGF